MKIARSWDEVNPVLYDGNEPVSTRVLEKQYREAIDKIKELEVRIKELETIIDSNYE